MLLICLDPYPGGIRTVTNQYQLPEIWLQVYRSAQGGAGGAEDSWQSQTDPRSRSNSFSHREALRVGDTRLLITN